MPQPLRDVAVVVSTGGLYATLVYGVDRFPPTRRILDRIDPSRVHARHPSAGRALAASHVRRVPAHAPFDFERDS